MAKIPGSPDETTATREPASAKLERLARPLELGAVVARAALLAAARRHAGEVRPVADQHLGARQRGLRLRASASRAPPDRGRRCRGCPRRRRAAARPRARARATCRARRPGRPRRAAPRARAPSSPARRTRRGRRPRPAPAASRTFAKLRPSFITTAASVVASRVASTSAGSVPGSIGEASRRGARAAGRPLALAALSDVTPGTTTVRIARREPLVQVDVGAVEHGIALAQHRDVATRVEVRRERRGPAGRRTRSARPRSRRDGRSSSVVTG